MKIVKYLKRIWHVLCESEKIQLESLQVQKEILAFLQRQYSNAVSLEFWRINPDGTRSKIEMAFTLTDIQQVTLAITAVDARGNPAKLDGAPVWATSDAALLSIVASEDGLSCVATAVGPLGTAQVTVSADADLGEGTRELAGLLDVEIIASEALNITIVPGTPV